MTSDPAPVREPRTTDPQTSGGIPVSTHDSPLQTPATVAGGRAPVAPAQGSTGHTVTLHGVKSFYGDNMAVKGVDLEYRANEVTAMIGPSGCGKSTLLRSINRMHEEIPGARVEGEILLDGVDINAPGTDIVAIRRMIGMVFQRPNPFPTMSIRENVAAGLKFNKIKDVDHDERVEWALRGAGLWDEVKDRLNAPGVGLSGGQQQRLCIARTIAIKPDVILMDEPCSALDPIATLKVEELIQELKQDFTIVLVTHNMQQAARVGDRTAFMYLGDLVEVDATEKIFTNPSDPRTEEYVSGKFS
ncbi:Phosphate transport ATP-binding protein PstB (TC 3.A.1.7.1) [Patulibacter medicamentivorans]|uniref:Phosphate transport ATP-binding protein PstB (TC 3.A.1.7.1) n=1 Tax=Patulibacter medicamentivorans TaxID=1097667 RepID=H0E649_9ACTN|nr:phosphate ABC transporter ATP-binding protein PstB [Patulibacter medicamentivorans]EHN10818.1 Phosphate transport ATP-binding protein PstB (TC 3.A.1.7.1) [Patulibacter medicamentivorans]